MKVLPSKEQLVPGIILGVLAVAIVFRVAMIRNVVIGAPAAA